MAEKATNELDARESTFILGLLSQITIKPSQSDAAEVVRVTQSITQKLTEIIKEERVKKPGGEEGDILETE